MCIYAAVALAGPRVVAAAEALTQYQENLVYLDYAERASLHCRRVGVETGALFEAWAVERARVRTAAEDALRAAAHLAIHDPAEAEIFLSDAAVRRLAQADQLIANNGVPCNAFSKWLTLIAQLIRD